MNVTQWCCSCGDVISHCAKKNDPFLYGTKCDDCDSLTTAIKESMLVEVSTGEGVKVSARKNATRDRVAAEYLLKTRRLNVRRALDMAKMLN